MSVTIDSELIRQSGMTEREFLVEIACRLFAAQIFGKGQAGRLCGLDRVQFESELYKRDLPVYIYTREMLNQDLEFVRSFEADGAGRK